MRTAHHPVFHDGELQYASMPTVGQAVILFGKAELLPEQNGER